MTPATLSAIRDAEGDTLSAFSARLGISRNTLARMEAGKSPIPRYIALAATCIYRKQEEIVSINVLLPCPTDINRVPEDSL